MDSIASVPPTICVFYHIRPGVWSNLSIDTLCAWLIHVLLKLYLCAFFQLLITLRVFVSMHTLYLLPFLQTIDWVKSYLGEMARMIVIACPLVVQQVQEDQVLAGSCIQVKQYTNFQHHVLL
ncbi:hypothetical protein AVEN_251184-1 [Araneus ventricosus]|uniref:Uncharacterized protein n=1 Tax=Araneus ventricosus TaxID=182803 RepID=A0A4Y2QGE3_ARAVE|nr:hypothetical protein AVEN_251184-1 [Araneus ventricosus]